MTGGSCVTIAYMDSIEEAEAFAARMAGLVNEAIATRDMASNP